MVALSEKAVRGATSIVLLYYAQTIRILFACGYVRDKPAAGRSCRAESVTKEEKITIGKLVRMRRGCLEPRQGGD